MYLGPRRRRRVRAARRPRCAHAGRADRAPEGGVLETVGSTRHAATGARGRAACRRRRRRRRSARDGLVVVGVDARRSRATSARCCAARRRRARRQSSLEPRIGRCVQSQGRARLGRRDLRGSRRGGVGRRWRRSTRSASAAGSGWAADAARRHALRRASTSPRPTAVVLGNEARGLADRSRRPPRRPGHDPDGRARRVAQRGDGRRPCCASRRRASAAGRRSR